MNMGRMTNHFLVSYGLPLKQKLRNEPKPSILVRPGLPDDALLSC